MSRCLVLVLAVAGSLVAPAIAQNKAATAMITMEKGGDLGAALGGGTVVILF